jgi:hypothetical protein
MIRLVFVLCLFYVGCSPSELTVEDLNAFLRDEENGLHKTAEMNGTQVAVTYKPTDLWVSQELDEGEVLTSSRLDSLRKKYENYYYFIVSLSRNNKEALHQTGDMGEYSELLQTMSFRMSDYVTLTTTSRDTIPVADFMLNRTYGMSSATEILFVFNREKSKGQEWVQFNLNEFGLNVGNQRFRFATKDLEHTPKLKFTITK